MWRLLLSLSLLPPTVFGCLRIQSTRPPTLPPVTGEPAMNGCKCPQITYATKETIEQNEYGAYLANREVTKPPVTIASDCEIIVEVEDIMVNMYFMIFRDGAPPIFNSRLYDKQPGTRFVPHGISCEAVGDKFQWHNFGGPVHNMSIALQSNEEMCGCDEWDPKGGYANGVAVPAPNITKLYETCDVRRVDCVASNPLIGNMRNNFGYGTWTEDSVWEDYTCVSGNWHHNGVRTEKYTQQFTCKTFETAAPTFLPPTSFQCGCRDVWNANTLIDLVAQKYNIGLPIPGYTPLRGDPVTYATNDVCTPTFHCPSDTDLLVIYSMNYKPLYYENGALPQMSCRATPLATTSESVRYWFLEGIMLTEPAYACNKKDIPTTTPMVPCTCKFTASDDMSDFVLGSDHARLVWDFPYRAADYTESADGCKKQLFCKGPKEREIIFAFNTTQSFATVNRNDQLEITCDRATNKWQVKNSTYDEVGAFCSDGAGERSCLCREYLLDSNTNMTESFPNMPLSQNLSLYPLSRPDYGKGDCLYYEVDCRPKTKTLVLFNETFYAFGNLTATQNPTSTCNPFNHGWDMIDLIGYTEPVSFYPLYSVCVDYTAIPKCVCPVTSVNQNNVQSVLKDHPFLKNISSYILGDPEITPDPSDTCSKIFTCPAGQSLVLLDKTEAYFYKKGGSIPASCNPYGQTWFADDGVSDSVVADELFVTCAKYQYTPPLNCHCVSSRPGQGNYQQLVGNHPFLSNITQYPWDGAAMAVSGCEVVVLNLPDKIGVVVLLDTMNRVFAFNEGGAYARCNPDTNEWQVTDRCSGAECEMEGAVIVKELYPFFVEYSVPTTTIPPPTTPATPCVCPVLPGISELTRGQYDPNDEMNGWVVPYTMTNETVNTNICYQSTIGCPNDLYIFGGPGTAMFNMPSAVISCERNSEQVAQWRFQGMFLNNANFGCVKPEEVSGQCSCTVLQQLSDTTRSIYDPNNEMGGEIQPIIPGIGNWIGQTLCYKYTLTCSDTFYVYNQNAPHYALKVDGASTNGVIELRCMKPKGSAASDKHQWFYGTQQFGDKPGYACVK